MEDENNKSNFIRDIIDSDIRLEKNDNRVHTRFPPEPNGYLHIGHAKSICLNFGIAESYPNGKCNLRFDDTNPLKEEEEYVDSIIEDVQWLGFNVKNRIFFASDYFDQFYDYAVQLVIGNLAYVDDQLSEEIKNTRGTLKDPGVNSPYRNRSVEENLDLFQKMKDGLFKDGEKVLRAKIDMSHPNLNMRDPIMYRILHINHHRTDNKWCIYPMYDWAHGLEDSLEKITHSICTLEFQDHRLLYDWFLDQLDIYHPQQIEFARLNLNYTIMSKRKLKRLVDEKYVSSWDDPRMPTISGLRRRGYTPEAIKLFANHIGVVKRDSIIDIALLDYFLREDLNKKAQRVMVVLDPIKLVITNYPDSQVEEIDADNNPENALGETRKIPFSKEIYIERSDFMENPPKKYFRLSVGSEVRLKHAYYVICTNFIKDDNGIITEVHCTYDPKTRGGWSDDGRKVRGTLHWVSVNHALDAEIRLYDKLFNVENPESQAKDFVNFINENSYVKNNKAKLESSLGNAERGTSYQFIRTGYFCLDTDSTKKKIIFNKTIGLRDSWSKKQK